VQQDSSDTGSRKISQTGTKLLQWQRLWTGAIGSDETSGLALVINPSGHGT